MFLLEGKSVNPANTEKSDKNGNIALVDLKYFTILKYFSMARKNLRRYINYQIYFFKFEKTYFFVKIRMTFFISVLMPTQLHFFLKLKGK